MFLNKGGVQVDRNESLRLSRFTHFYPLGNYTAIYNSLNLAVVFLERGLADEIKNGPIPGNSDELQVVLEQMKQWRMLVDTGFDEMSDYRALRRALEKLPVAILYLLLTDLCNFACHYCFIEGAQISQRRGLMTEGTAKRGIDIFARTLQLNPNIAEVRPQIIFYGGEPLINSRCLLFALEYTRELKEKRVLPENLTLTVNTNASLVTPTIATALADYNVRASVSIDGTPNIHNAQRVFRSGKGTFEATKRGLLLLQQAGVEASVSFTITWANLEYVEESLRWLVENLGIKSLGFNIHRDSETIKVENPTVFAQKASETLIKCFEIARKLGIYEDRMMRKVKTFVTGRPHLNDCAGCGQQIVVAPSGEIGVCHVLFPKGEYFIDYTPDFSPRVHPYWVEWRKRSPFSMPQCLDCIALGICGGGCPQQALLKHGSIWELDEVFCVHAKATLDFLLRDLLEKTLNQDPSQKPMGK